MTDGVRLYVFEGQNFVSEKDYRAVLEQRQGFENAALDNETAAKKAKEQLAACRREFFEYRKVAWENEEIGHKALDDLQQAREAGRREGLEEAAQRCGEIEDAVSVRAGNMPFSETQAAHSECAALCELRIRALIDSPKAEGEEKYDGQ